MNEQARCTGHCCRRFPVNAPLEYLKIQGEELGPDSEPAKIADMLISLGQHPNADGKMVEMYTCRHHDTERGDCRIYENRPRMCIDYPYDSACEHKECTADPATVGLVKIRHRAKLRPGIDAADLAAAAKAAVYMPLPTKSPDHIPGARNSGHKKAPPLPRWARERSHRTGRPGR